jgi:DNA-binding response OmpR family regulator
LRAGANAYFDKPVRIAELKECVQQLLVSHQETSQGSA